MILFFFGNGIFVVLGIALLVAIALGGSVLTWLAENAVLIGILLLVIHCFYALGIGAYIYKCTLRVSVSIFGALFHCIPPVFVVISGYQSMLREAERFGITSAAFDVGIALAIYGAAELAWRKMVIQDHAKMFGAVTLSIIHFIFSIFMICVAQSV